ncbi:unnamed protein product, partial [Closterium sp. Naga37s-1]
GARSGRDKGGQGESEGRVHCLRRLKLCFPVSPPLSHCPAVVRELDCIKEDTERARGVYAVPGASNSSYWSFPCFSPLPPSPPCSVVRELDGIKEDKERARGVYARRALRLLRDALASRASWLRAQGAHEKADVTGSIISIGSSNGGSGGSGQRLSADDAVLSCCLYYHQFVAPGAVVLLTGDIALQVKLHAKGPKEEDEWDWHFGCEKPKTPAAVESGDAEGDAILLGHPRDSKSFSLFPIKESLKAVVKGVMDLDAISEQPRREEMEGQAKEQFSTEPTQAAATGAPGYAAGGTAVSAPGYAGGGYVATATGPGFTCTAQEFPTAGGGATGVAAVTDTEGRTIYYSTTMQPMGVTGPGVTETGVTATGVPAMGGAAMGGGMGGGTATGVPAAGGGGMGEMGKGTDMSGMEAGMGGESLGTTGMGGGGTAGGEAGGMGGGIGATGGGDTEMMVGDVGGESIGARGSAEPAGGEKKLSTGAAPEGGMGRTAESDLTSGGDIAEAKEAGAAAAGGETGGVETGGEGFMGRESEAKALEGEGGIGSA